MAVGALSSRDLSCALTAGWNCLIWAIAVTGANSAAAVIRQERRDGFISNSLDVEGRSSGVLVTQETARLCRLKADCWGDQVVNFFFHEFNVNQKNCHRQTK
jgi:hypothetical protein